jgi:hypothetical protein
LEQKKSQGTEISAELTDSPCEKEINIENKQMPVRPV